MSRFAVGFLLCASLFADSYPRQPAIDVEHYRFDVQLNDENNHIEGKTTVQVRIVREGVTSIALDFAQTMHVAEVTSEAGPLKFTHHGERIAIVLGAAPKVGATVRLTVKYSGTPANGLKFVKNKYGERCFFSANWPDLAHEW